MAHFSLFSEQPIGSYFYLTPRKRASSASKYFFSESARSLSTAAFSAFCPTTRIFLVDTCETADKSKDMCKCVYLKRVFIQIYFRILFTGSEELWLFLIHTHASHPKLFKKKKKLKHGTRIFLAVTFFLCDQNFNVIFHTSHLPPSRCCCDIPSSKCDIIHRTFIGETLNI